VTLALLLVGLPPFPALHAATPETAALTEEAFLGEVPVILGATRLSQPLSESPAAITVIDRDMIEASGALDIPEVLRLVPGFQVGHVDGHRYTVTYHGLADAYARRMQVLVDGRSVYTPVFGGVIWSTLPLAIEDIDRIEVIRGPNGVTYGANSFAAVINIITRHASQDQGTLLKYTRGDLETRKGLLRHGATNGDFSYRLTTGYREDIGFEHRPDGKQVNLATFRGDYAATSRDALETQFGYNGGVRGKGRESSASNPPREEATTSHFGQVRWRHTVSAQEEVSLQFYYNYHRSFDTYKIALVDTLMEDFIDERYDLELQHTLSPAKDVRLVWGVETRRDRVRGAGWFNTDHYISTDLNRLFANAEWRFAPDWILNAGAMYEHSDITGGDISPRLALNYHVTPTDTLRASASRAYRTPSTIEYKADTGLKINGSLYSQLFKSTQTLRPERITSYELGYLTEWPEARLGADLKLFREEIRDVISQPSDTSVPDLTPTTATGVFRNDGASNAHGAEAQLRYQPLPNTRLVLATAYAEQRGRALKRLTPSPSYGDTDRSTPALTHSLLVMQRFPRQLEASAAYYRQTSMRWLDGGDDDDTGTIKNLDLRLAYKLRQGQTRGEISVVAQNMRANFFDYANQIFLDKRFLLNLGLEFR
jgi:iron complex outermembrane receptor protein